MDGAKYRNPHQVLEIIYYKNQIWLIMLLERFAPVEGNRLLGIFLDKESEFLSFPTIYCGQTRADNKERTTPVTTPVSGLRGTIL